MVLTVADIIGRGFFRAPVPDSYDIVGYLLVLATLTSMGYTQQRKQNVRIGILIERLPPRAGLALDSAFYIIMAIFLALVVWQGLLESLYSLERGSASTILGIPAFPFHLFVPIGCLLIFIQLVLDLITFSRKLRTQKDSKR